MYSTESKIYIFFLMCTKSYIYKCTVLNVFSAVKMFESRYICQNSSAVQQRTGTEKSKFRLKIVVPQFVQKTETENIKGSKPAMQTNY